MELKQMNFTDKKISCELEKKLFETIYDKTPDYIKNNPIIDLSDQNEIIFKLKKIFSRSLRSRFFMKLKNQCKFFLQKYLFKNRKNYFLLNYSEQSSEIESCSRQNSIHFIPNSPFQIIPGHSAVIFYMLYHWFNCCSTPTLSSFLSSLVFIVLNGWTW